MSKVLILVEGQTEETFVGKVLAPHLSASGVYPIAKLATTNRVPSGPDFKGGIIPYARFRRDVKRLLGDTSAAMVTTMIDFYGLPANFVGTETLPAGSCYEQVAHLEKEMRQDINHRKFLPYLALHEFEALLFTAPEKIAQAFPHIDKGKELEKIKQQFKSPEEIDIVHKQRLPNGSRPSFQSIKKRCTAPWSSWKLVWGKFAKNVPTLTVGLPS